MSKLSDLLAKNQGLSEKVAPTTSSIVATEDPTQAGASGPSAVQQRNPAMKPTEAPLFPPTRPSRASASEVLFQSFQPSMGYFFKGTRKAFESGYRLVTDPDEVEYLKKNFCPHPDVASPRMQIIEEGFLGKPESNLLTANPGPPTPDGGQFGKSA